MAKKTLIIISIIGLLIIAGLIWFFWFRTPVEPGQENGGGFFSSLFPTSGEKPVPGFPSSGEGNGFPITGTTTEPIFTIGSLTQLTNIPVSGAAFDEKTKKIKYIEKSTGYLYEISPDGTEREQLTITTIPKIFEVFWSKDTTHAALKYFGEDRVYTFLASFSTTTEGIFLPSSTFSIVVSPEENKIFYLMRNNQTEGIISSFDNKNKKEIFSSVISEFLIDWPQKDIITLLTKPSAGIDGYFYKLSPQTGSFTKILGGYSGLTALYSPAGDKIIASISELNSFVTELYDESDKKFSSLGITTLPEKCFFSQVDENIVYCAAPRFIPAADYPDDWYQGLFFFSDNLWKINLSSGSTEIIFDKEDLDIMNIFSDEEENYLFFQNKKDLSLWSLNIF